ncbi:hypothetical protein LEM8419_03555 [Neolewinella maritima]|uniref:DUF4157 domain-containing protein n=1 Tax=Neolewinella maritima TaxID=1383882 RepID=A0ABN8FBG1_9BACT|nr:hypothetical protein [Neolewinella maritima]CAH1002683.1 hypothetical protein LEM8419_03555 [Neolewinella maritima]
MPKTKKRSYKIPLFPAGRLYVLFGKSFAKIAKEENLNGAYKDHAAGVWVWEGDYYVGFGLDEFSIPIIAHEAVHVANNILDHVGVKADHNNDETLAYMVSWVVGKVLDAQHDLKVGAMKQQGK